MSRLTNIFVYPIKGCSGISLDHAELNERGIKYDRRWMLVDESGKFISQRSSPEMALIDLKIEGEFLIVSYKEYTHEVSLERKAGQSINVTVWDDTVKAYLTSEQDNQWFSMALNKKVRLVAMLEDSIRPVDPRYAVSEKDEVSFADGYPFLIIGESSMEQLNTRIGGERLLMDRFRPNLVFEGGLPHEEDTWREFKIGDSQFYGVKPCARCQVTMINQQTGAQGKEPLETLSGYRKIGNKILFGQNCLLKSGASISVNDEIVVQKTGNSPI